MLRNRRKKTSLVIALLIAILSMSIVFAAMSTTLQIRGAGTVNASDWSIKFENLAPVTLTGAAVETQTPQIVDDTEIGTYNVTLKRPGDVVTYNFDVHNYGTLDAVIERLNIPVPVCTGLATDDEQKVADAEIVSEGLTYSLTYSDGTELQVGDELKAGEVRSLILTLRFDGDKLPSAQVQIGGLGISIVYSQNIGTGDEVGGNDELIVDLSSYESIWLGDSIMAGSGNNAIAYPNHFQGLTNIRSLNASFGGTTISDNTPDSIEFNHPKTLKGEVERLIANQTNFEYNYEIQYDEIDLIVLDGGGNDVIAYTIGDLDPSLKKEIGTASDTTSDTVLNDFREAIELIKDTFPNAEILYLQTYAFDEIGLKNIVTTAYFEGKTLEEINAAYSQNFATMIEAKDGAVTMVSDLKNKIDTMLDRSEALFGELPTVANELGIEYLDLSTYIAANLTTDTGDYVNDYLQEDLIHLVDNAYAELTPYIVTKVESMIEK